MIVKVANIHRIDDEWSVTFNVSSSYGVNFDFICSVPVNVYLDDGKPESLNQPKAVSHAFRQSKFEIEERFRNEEFSLYNLIGAELNVDTGEIINDESSNDDLEESNDDSDESVEDADESVEDSDELTLESEDS